MSLDDSPETWINDILPKDLSTYFFFDTERVNNVLAIRKMLQKQ